MAVEIAQEAFAAAGYEVEYQEASWTRCVQDARAGQFTGIIAAIPADAPDFIFPKTPIGLSGSGYAVRRGENFDFADTHSLDKRVLGVTRGYSFKGVIGDYATAHAADPNRVAFASGDGALAKNLGKLVAGRVDVVMDDRNVLMNAVADLGLESQVTLIDEPAAVPVYIAFSPRAPQPQLLARILDEGIARLRQTGRLQSILARYHVAAIL
jgi:polar amino acid transport system substrate-binding protein